MKFNHVIHTSFWVNTCCILLNLLRLNLEETKIGQSGKIADIASKMLQKLVLFKMCTFKFWPNKIWCVSHDWICFWTRFCVLIQILNSGFMNDITPKKSVFSFQVKHDVYSERGVLKSNKIIRMQYVFIQRNLCITWLNFVSAQDSECQCKFWKLK